VSVIHAPARRLMADVSNNNHRPDFAAYRHRGHIAIGIKATEGVGGRQANYPEWVEAAHHQRLQVIHYLFAHPDHHSTVDAEAHDFLAFIRPHVRRGDRVALDLEVQPAGGVNLHTYTHRFAQLVREHIGHRHGWLYSYRSYFDQHGGAGPLTPPGWRVWLADYELTSRPYWAHQFTDGQQGPGPRECAGVGPCDVSVLTRRAWVGLQADRLRRRPGAHR
jgi:Glycosyl hydrolases family 25